MKFATSTLAAVAATLVIASAPAFAYSEDVQKKCQDDYLKLCSEFPPGSADMRKCMEKKGKQVSDRCINALVDAGEIDKKLRR